MCRRDYRIGYQSLCFQITEGILKRFNDFSIISSAIVPQLHFIPVKAVGIGNIKHIVKVMAALVFTEQGNSFCAFVNPAAQFIVPYRKACTGCCVGALGID
ncbi:hypothetical protein INF28_11135 [Oscillospiraceae bacterium DSM 107454]|uniref:Uncharacterized protein n=1 Tax=Ructibacterium gallinarum TaxID=2779355 RepID=A0A9D5M7K5_9FIRM|nr:hypothetical protein [Ructibacterium gallinarum]